MIDEELKQILDYKYWCREVKNYDIGFVDDKLLYKQYYEYLFWQLHLKINWSY